MQAGLEWIPAASAARELNSSRKVCLLLYDCARGGETVASCFGEIVWNCWNGSIFFPLAVPRDSFPRVIAAAAAVARMMILSGIAAASLLCPRI